jgi:hypothetical protein
MNTGNPFYINLNADTNLRNPVQPVEAGRTNNWLTSSDSSNSNMLTSKSSINPSISSNNNMLPNSGELGMATLQNCQQYSTHQGRQACRQFIIEQYQKYQQHLQQKQPSIQESVSIRHGLFESPIEPVDSVEVFGPSTAVKPLSDLVVMSKIETAEEVAKPAEELAKSAEELTKPAEELAKPAEELAKPAEELAKPAEELAKPAEEVVKPSEEMAQPAEEVAQPTEEVVKPTEEVVKPATKVAMSNEEVAKDADEVVKPADIKLVKALGNQDIVSRAATESVKDAEVVKQQRQEERTANISTGATVLVTARKVAPAWQGRSIFYHSG